MSDSDKKCIKAFVNKLKSNGSYHNSLCVDIIAKADVFGHPLLYISIYMVNYMVRRKTAQKIEQGTLSVPTGDCEFYEMESPLSLWNIFFPISIGILLVWKGICSLLNR